MSPSAQIKLSEHGTWISLRSFYFLTSLIVIAVVWGTAQYYRINGELEKMQLTLESTSQIMEGKIDTLVAQNAALFQAFTDELQRRTWDRWSSDMDGDSWIDFIRRNPGKDLNPPDIQRIKRERDAARQ